jgi:hypothetical protein
MRRGTPILLVLLAAGVAYVVLILWIAQAGAQAPVRAARYGDGLRVTWPGTGPACVFRARDGQPLVCSTSPWRQAWQDAGLLVRAGEVVEVRRLDGSVLGRGVVRWVNYLPSAQKGPRR